ncbi:MAG: hypothetical protein K0Q95_30 [Bacteroidota bacterium]|jgi:gliding motility-associated-like protein|nr:hypothetical protein [Bacteroidota bacterium]
MKKTQHLLLVLMSLVTLQVQLFGQTKENPQIFVATNNLVNPFQTGEFALRAPCNATSCASPIAITLTTLGTQICAPVQCNDASQTAGPDFLGNNCYDLPNPTIWYSVVPPVGTSTLQINVSSSTTNPTFAVYSTTDCSTFTIYDDNNECYSGAGGSVSGNMAVPNNGTTILIGVSAPAGQTGTFNVCVTPQADNSACNLNATLVPSSTSMGSPLNGPYLPGETVRFCYTINQYTQTNCNWLQGIVPTFGDCWDASSFSVTGQPTVTTALAQAGNYCSGAWAWWPSGSVTYNSTGANVGAGWFFSQPAGLDPDNSWGDANGMCSSGMGSCEGATSGLTWSVCFNLTVTTNCATNPDCGVSIKTYADGEIGSWTSVGCVADLPDTYNATVYCCLMTVNAGTDNSVCSNSSVALSGSYLNNNGATTVAWTASPAAALAGLSSTTSLTPTFTPPAGVTGPVTFTLTATDQQCTMTDNVVITVNPVNTIAAGTSPTVCINTAMTNITLATTGATGATFSGLPAGVTGSWAGNVVTISGTPTASGTFNYTVTTTGGCPPATATGTITVRPASTISLSSAAATNAQTVCINNPITNITYAVGGSATGATVSGLPAGVTGSFAGGVFTISGTPSTTVGSPFSYTVSTTGPCAVVTATGTITVTPSSTISLTSAAATNAQTVCINTAINNITYAVGGSATGATVSGLPAGVTGSFSSGVFTISGSPSTTVGSPFSYTVTTSGPCAAVTATGTITVNPNATISLTSAAATNAQTICLTAPITNITYSIGGGGTGGTVTGLPAGVTGSFAGGTFTISGTPTATGTFNYTVNTTGICTQTSATGSITINPNATIALTSAAATTSQTLCINNAITNITYSIGGGGTGATVAGLPAGVSGSFSAGTFTISGTPSASGTFNYTVTTTGTCNQVTASGTITVNPVPVITSAPFTNETSCGANNGTITIVATGTGLTYSINGGTTFVATNAFTNLAAGSYNIVVMNSAGCTTSGGVISISAAGAPAMPTANASPNPICAGNTLTLSVASPVGGETYTWSGPGGFSATGSSVTRPSVTTAMTGVYSVTASVGSCVSPAGTVTVTVNPNATISLSSAAATDAQTICATAAITNITYAIGGGGTGGTVTGLPAGVSGSFSSGTFTINGTPSVTGTFNYTVNTTGSCAQTSATGSITINPNAAIALSSAAATTSQSLCVNTAITNITYTVSGGGTGATVTGLPAGVTGSFAGGTFTISGAPSVTGTFSYTVNTTGTCAQVSSSGTIIVNPDATITLSSAVGTNTQSLCINTAITNITYAIGGGGTGGTVTGLPAGLTGSFSAGTFSISGTATAAGTFNYTVNTTGTCAQVSASGTITVNPDATITLSSAVATDGQSLCINTAITNITYSISGGGTGATVSGLPAGVSGSFSGGTFTISGIPSVTGTFNYTVNTTGTCVQSSATGTITVNPDATITLTSAAATTAQTLCINTLITDITYSIAGGGTGATVAGLPAGVTGSVTGGILTISGTPSVSGVFTYTVNTSGTCAQTSTTGTISVNPLPVFTVSSTNPTTCGGSEGTITLSGLTANTSYNVSYSNGTSTVGPTALTSDASGNIIITGLVQGSYNAIMAELAGCSTTDAGTYTLTDPNPPVFTVTTANPTSCGGTDGTLTISGLTASSVYTVTYMNGATMVGPASLTSDASGNIVITGLSQGSYSNIIVGIAGCNTTDGGPYTLTEPGAPVFNVASSNPTTCGGSEGTITLSGLTPSTAYNVSYFNGTAVVGPTSLTTDATGSIAITGLTQGTYTAITVELAGCSTTEPTASNLVDPAAPTFIVSSVNPTSCGGTDGSLTLSGLNATTSYNVTYSFGATVVGPASMTSNASGDIVISGLGQGSYSAITVELTACSTTSAGPFVLFDPNTPVFTVSTTNPTTCGGTDGTISLTGLIASTSYNVTYSNGATTVGPTALTTNASGGITITGLGQGSYSNVTVELTGCSTNNAGPFILSDPNAPVFTVTSANPTTCTGTDGTLTLTGLTANTAYDITYSNGATAVGPVSMTSNASGNIVITGLSQGTYSDVIANLLGCSTTIAGPFTLTDPSAPVFTSVAANPTTCGGSNGTITLSGLSPNTVYNIGYLNGATIVGPGVMTSDATGNIVITGLGQGSYSNITVNLSGCTSTDAGPYVITSPTPPNAPTATGAAYCPGAAIGAVTATGTGGTFNWYDDAALTLLLSSNASYTPSTLVTDTYYVTETVGGCTSPATAVTITINSAPFADAGNTQMIGCGISSVPLDGSLSASGASITYTWTTSTGSIISNGTSTAPTVGSAGTYTITVADNTTGCVGIDSVVVTGSPSPVASFTADPTTGTHPLTVNFTNSSQNANTYIWNFGDGFGASTLDASDIYVTPGTYTVSLIASDNLSCPDTAYATIIVLDDYTLVIPNIFTPNSDGINDQFKVLSTGAESLKGTIYDRWGLKIYDWSNIAEGWDGRTSSGVEVSAGTYYYILDVKAQDGKEYNYTGFIQLLR